MLSQSAPPQSVPQTMLSSSLVPQTMLSPSNVVPQTMLSSPSVPQTMLSSPSVPHTMLSPLASCVPQTMLSQPSPHSVPHTMLSSSLRPWAAPQITLRGPGVADRAEVAARDPMVAPDDLLAPDAWIGMRDAGRVRLVERRELHRAEGVEEARHPGGACVYPGYSCAVYCRMPFTRFGVRIGLAWSIRATVPATTGAAMLVPLSERYGLKPSDGSPSTSALQLARCRRCCLAPQATPSRCPGATSRASPRSR